ncbi:hypothetical protein GO002_30635 [Streptomyces eurocidicus]|nr:hypothetical protein [Streptomyces eurocidicus]
MVHPGDDTSRPLAGTFADCAPALAADPTGTPPWDGLQRPLHRLRLLAPIEPGAKIVCAGATYAAHLERLGLKVPDEPTAANSSRTPTPAPVSTAATSSTPAPRRHRPRNRHLPPARPDRRRHHRTHRHPHQHRRPPPRNHVNGGAFIISRITYRPACP